MRRKRRCRRAARGGEHDAAVTSMLADKSDVLTEDLILAEKRVDSIKHTCACTHKRILSCLTMSPSRTTRSYRQVLADCANLQMRLGQELLGYERETDRQVLQPTNQLLETDLPNISKLRRQLSKLTLDMDAAKNRYQTALKHVQQSGNLATTGACAAGGTSNAAGGAAAGSSTKTDGLREEAEDATSKVEQCRDALAAEMFGLIGREPEFAHLLVQWYQLQADHHRRALAQIDAALPSLWGLIGNSPQKPVFGFPLEEHLRVNGRRIALVVEKCATCLLASGMDEEGLFRITGSASKIKKLKSAFNAGFVDMSEFERDPHTVASVLKLYLRELPEPLMTFSLYEEWMKAASVSDSSARLQALWQVVNSLPQANHDNLRYVVKFLSRLVGHREQNKMSSQNIAIVIAPNLVWPKEENQSQHMGVNMGIANMHSSIVDTLVNYADWFFPGALAAFFSLQKKTSPPLPTRSTAVPDATHQAAPTTNGEVEGHLAGPGQSLTSQSPRIPHRPGKKAAPAAPLPPQPRDRTSIAIGAGSLPFDHRPGAPPAVGGGTLGRPRPMVKPQVAEKPTLQRRSLEGVVEGAAAAGMSYSTQSLERRPGRHQGAVGGRPQPCERPSVPPPERPKSGSLESAGRNSHHAPEASTAPDAQRHSGNGRGEVANEGNGRQQQVCYSNGRGEAKNHVAENALARRDSGERPLSLEHQEMLSFADESDSEDGSSILVSPSGGGSGSSNNGPSVMWKSCSASIPSGSEQLANGTVVLRRSPSRTNGMTPERPHPFQPTTTADAPAAVRPMDDSRWNFLTAAEQQPVPERPPRSSPSADPSEPKPSRQSPVLLDAIHTTGPPPDLITSSERPKSDPASPTKGKLECGAPSPVPVLPEATRL
ncbi:hypothetical protein HPB48_012266 [Haemaphysalis longicornis]|uniref:Rho-GAP domain-containing protein n=1 Tax=Haemaphysalis longicornis TaxID=44386 RepID=A0A9J6GLT7_HAELO|nr:hypothetical protein HPB48_012266 [Haemaphysalis longicornis]